MGGGLILVYPCFQWQCRHTTLHDGIIRIILFLAQFRRVSESARSRHLYLMSGRSGEQLINLQHNDHSWRTIKIFEHCTPVATGRKCHIHTFMLQKAVALTETEPDPVTYTVYVSYIDVSWVSLSKSMSGPRTSFTLNLVCVFSSPWPQIPCRVPSTNT